MYIKRMHLACPLCGLLTQVTVFTLRSVSGIYKCSCSAYGCVPCIVLHSEVIESQWIVVKFNCLLQIQ